MNKKFNWKLKAHWNERYAIRVARRKSTKTDQNNNEIAEMNKKLESQWSMQSECGKQSEPEARNTLPNQHQ